MKRMSTKQKNSWNKLTAKRTRRYLKRREHVRILKLAGDRINMHRKQIERLMHFRKKHNNTNDAGTARIL